MSNQHLASITDHDETFWRRLLLQISYKEIALQHLIVALSALSKSTVLKITDDLADKRTTFEFALQQYNLGIKALQSRGPQANYAVLLAAHLIITFVEKWLNEHQNAERSSIAIAQVLKSKVYTANDDPESTIAILELLVRREIDGYASLHTSEQASSPSITNCAEGIPEIFHNLNDANGYLDHTYSRILLSYQDRFIHQPTTSVQVFLQSAHSLLQSWRTPFYYLRTQILGSNDPSSIRDILFVDLRYNLMEIACCISVFPRHGYPKRCTDVLEDLFIICSKIWEIEGHLIGQTDDSVVRTFVPENGIAICLHLVALFSTDLNIRQQAVRLLYRIKKVEGSFASDALAIVAEHIVRIEADMPGTDLPQANVSYGNQVEPISIDYQNDRTPSGESDDRHIPDSLLFEINGPTAHIEVQWIRSADQEREIQRFMLELDGYSSQSLVRSRSIHWWPTTSAFPLLEAELSLEERRKDGPHFGFESFRDTYDFSFQNICNLTILRTGSRKQRDIDTSS